MNVLLLVVGGFVGLFFVVIPFFLFLFWYVSYNKYAIILKEVGEDENDVIVRRVKCKVINNQKIGQIIKFFPFSGFNICKNFDSSVWTSIKHKNKFVEGIILYCQGTNFRPVVLRKSAEKSFFLDVKDEDNRKFLMQYEIMRDKIREDYNMLKWGVLGFFATIIFIGIAALFVVLFIMDENTKNYFIYQGAELVIK